MFKKDRKEKNQNKIIVTSNVHKANEFPMLCLVILNIINNKILFKIINYFFLQFRVFIIIIIIIQFKKVL